MADGLGFVADGSAGLAVLNYLSPDTTGVAPTASISLLASVVVGTSGSSLEVTEGSTIPVLASASDNVQVHNVELLVNGKVVEDAVSAPFNLAFTLPTIAQNGTAPITVQVEAIDTGGNVGLSNTLSLLLVKNSTPPQLVSSNIPNGATVGSTFQTVILQFSKSLDESTVVPADFQLIAPGGTTLAPTGIQFRNNDLTVQVTLPTLELGTYQFVINEASITDRSGNTLGSGSVKTSFDVSSYAVSWINPNGGDWSNPANWDSGVVPGVGDNVVIDVTNSSGAMPTITYDSGTTEIASLVSMNPLTLAGGSLTVDTTLEVDNTFTLAGGTLVSAEVVNGPGSEPIVATSESSSTLNNVTLDSGLDLTSAYEATIDIVNGLTLNGTMTLGGQYSQDTVAFSGAKSLSGTGTVNMNDGTLDTSGAGALLVGPGITINGPGTIYATGLTNQGTITVAGAYNVLSLELTSFQNEGTIGASGGASLTVTGVTSDVGTVSIAGSGTTVSLSGTSYTINSSLSATDGETLDLLGGFSVSAGVTVSVDDATLGLGGVSNLTGLSLTDATLELLTTATFAELVPLLTGGTSLELGPDGMLENTGDTIALDATTGNLTLDGGTIKGGTITSVGGAEVVAGKNYGNYYSSSSYGYYGSYGSYGSYHPNASSSTLDGVILACDLEIEDPAASVSITDGLTLDDSTIYLGNAPGTNYGYLFFSGTQTLGGTGTVLFGKNNLNELSADSGATLTLGSGITVRGSSGEFKGDTIVNDGTIAADDSGGAAGAFAYDSGFSSGNREKTANEIDLSGVTNPAPESVYQTVRYDNSTYTLGGLTVGASYTLRLHFADFQLTAAGQQQFDVSVNGTQVLTNFDIFATVVANTAVVETFTATANSQGQVLVAFNYGAAGRRR